MLRTQTQCPIPLASCIVAAKKFWAHYVKVAFRVLSDPVRPLTTFGRSRPPGRALRLHAMFFHTPTQIVALILSLLCNILLLVPYLRKGCRCCRSSPRAGAATSTLGRVSVAVWPNVHPSLTSHHSPALRKFSKMQMFHSKGPGVGGCYSSAILDEENGC